jgi:2'-5' RNA ligase
MRCFIAVWPDAAARDALHRLASALLQAAGRGRAMRPANVHLTLAFIGELDDARALAAARACERLHFEPFEWQVTTIGYFARSRVVWAGGDAPPPLASLAEHSRSLLDGLAIGYDRKPFVPHVTLLRDVPEFGAVGPLSEPIAFPIAEARLYRSDRDEAGALYRRVG